ncbi:hypothetical protein PHYSODRAFT_498416 [Phytophthora sojae]|uniref:Uncharacterized protein n=1 Tax=Phytophthora sojae (strain P6497) TaxID=1094619 RepID=G4ZEF9_PHYSP|nr:hypothetical protein PHYSODRAFT_498416 [Phytophthora sojae]EGZ18424.1 hypothetical protein PHYSODRAFT_498416 [Phytophthora sojae]|eukprot:XP_009527482.1 hypothetical protein PHYSODRAFT_498416 [Phytophthora sojae]
MEHPSGRAAITFSKKPDDLIPLLNNAASEGHLEVMGYLNDQGFAVDFGVALLCAIRRDNMKAVTWLIAHFTPSEKIPEYCILVEAARYGRVGMLQYFQSSESLEVPGFPGSKLSSIPRTGTKFSPDIRTAGLNAHSTGWRSTDAMDAAAANGQRKAVKWLHMNRTEGCTKSARIPGSGEMASCEGFTDRAIHSAVLHDRIEVVKWLIPQAPTYMKSGAMEDAINKGNLALVQWLHTQAKVRCTANAMILAAGHDQLEILKYLYSHRPKGAALKSCGVAVERAMSEGHFRVALWCFKHFPARNPSIDRISITSTTRKCSRSMAWKQCVRERDSVVRQDLVSSRSGSTPRCRVRDCIRNVYRSCIGCCATNLRGYRFLFLLRKSTSNYIF